MTPSTPAVRVIFVHTEQYTDYKNEIFGRNFCSPILASGADITCLDFVRNHRDRTEPPNLDEEGEKLLAMIQGFHPDVIFYMHSWDDLPDWCFERIRASRLPIFTFLPDTLVETGSAELRVMRYSNYVGVCDSVSNYFRYRMLFDLTRGRPDGVLFIPGVYVPPELMIKPDVPKSRDVVILGSAELQRRALVDELRAKMAAHGIGFEKLGGLVDSARGNHLLGVTDGWLNFEAYRKTIGESKILISSQTNPARIQVKGKVFEFIGCGSFCLVDWNEEYELLMAGSGIVFWRDLDDLVHKCRYYLDHEEEREAIAAGARRWFLDTFDYKRYWQAFFAHISDPVRPLPVPQSIENGYRRIGARADEARTRMMSALAPAALLAPPSAAVDREAGTAAVAPEAQPVPGSGPRKFGWWPASRRR